MSPVPLPTSALSFFHSLTVHHTLTGFALRAPCTLVAVPVLVADLMLADLRLAGVLVSVRSWAAR